MLLARVPSGHLSLKGKTFKRIKIIKTGLAICIASLNAQEAIISRIRELEAFLSTTGASKIDKLTSYQSYLLTGISPLICRIRCQLNQRGHDYSPHDLESNE